MGRSAENIQKTKTDRKKKMKSEEKVERRIWRKSNNNNIDLCFKLYFARNHSLKKVHLYTIKFYLFTAGYLKHSNDTPKLNILKYTNYHIIEIYINRLSTTQHRFS